MKQHRKAWRNLLGTSGLATGLLIAAAVADEPPRSPPPPAAPAAVTPVKLEDVLVTAARSERAAATTPANVTIITAEEIANTNAQTVPDVLKYADDIQVVDYLGNGRTADVSTRGFGETGPHNTLVLVDGRRINSPDMSGVDWTTIPLERIERIEIVRGGGGVLYGDKAVGGVINIITKKGAPADTVTSETVVGSYQNFRQALGLAGSRGPLSYAVNGSYADTDGYRENNYFRNKTAGISLGYDADTWYKLDFSAGVKKDRYGMPGPVVDGTDPRHSDNPNDYAETESTYVQGTPAVRFGDDGVLKLNLSYDWRHSFARWAAWGTQNEFNITQYGIGPQYTQTWNIAGFANAFVAGIDYLAADLNAIDFYTGDIHKHEAGYYANDTIALVADKLFLDLGYRRARVNYDFQKGTDNAFDLDACRAALTWNYAAGSKAFVSFDRSFRTQLLEEFGGPFGNPLMEPQISYQYQAGVRHRFGNWLTAGATGFMIDTHKEIFYNPFTFQNTNYDRTRRLGLELAAESRPLDELKLFANYTWLDAEMVGGVYDGNRIPGVPTHSGSVGFLAFPDEKITLDVRARWVNDKPMLSDWQNVDRDWNGRNYIVVDAKISYRPFKWLELYAGVNNLFNQDYSEYGVWTGAAMVYPSPERNLVAGIKLTKEF